MRPKDPDFHPNLVHKWLWSHESALQASGIFYASPHPAGWGYNKSTLRAS